MFKLTLLLLGCTIGSCLNLQHQQKHAFKMTAGDYIIEYSLDNISVESLSISEVKISFRGCNQWMSPYSFEGTNLTTGPWMKTGGADCEDNTDEALIEAIDNTDFVLADSAELNFYDTDIDKTVLILRPT